MKVLVCDPISQTGIDFLKQQDDLKTIVLDRLHTEEELLSIVSDVSAIAIRSETKITKAVLEAAPEMKIVGRAGVGVDNIDVEAATRRGVLVMNAPEGNTVAAAEHTIALDYNDAEGVRRCFAELGDEIASEETYLPEWQSYTIQSGDSFALTAERTLGLVYSDVMQILNTVPDQKVLTRWRVGNSFDYKLDENGQLLALRVMKDPREGYLIQRDDCERFAIAADLDPVYAEAFKYARRAGVEAYAIKCNVSRDSITPDGTVLVDNM